MGDTELLEKFSFSNTTLEAFVAEGLNSIDTWLADTAVNAHIVNNIKWFIDFHPFTTEVGTADRSTILSVEGGGTVEIVFDNPDEHRTIL